jgi:hypothetical protein
MKPGQSDLLLVRPYGHRLCPRIEISYYTIFRLNFQDTFNGRALTSPDAAASALQALETMTLSSDEF